MPFLISKIQSFTSSLRFDKKLISDLVIIKNGIYYVFISKIVKYNVKSGI